MRTKKQMIDEADQIAANIETGKVRGKAALKKARYRMYNLRYRASLKKDAKKLRKKKIAKDQGFLPGFLQTLDMIRVEEMIAQKVFEAMKADKKASKKQYIEFVDGTRKAV